LLTNIVIMCYRSGGGQEQGATIHKALQRECLEVISVEEVIGELKFVREYIGKNHEFAELDVQEISVEGVALK